MNNLLRLMICLAIGSLAGSVFGQANYSTPYPFVTLAGMAGNNGAAEGMNSSALFYWPEGTAVDTNGNVYVVDNYENTVRELTPAGTNWVVTTIAGVANSSG